MSNRKARFECKKRSALQKMVTQAKMSCKWNKKCVAKKVRPVMWRLRKAKHGCQCVMKLKVMKKIWKSKAIKCGGHRKLFIIKYELKKTEKKINYLKKLLRPTPSFSPRWKKW
ncbi:hypothetical protein BWQ96_07701 [Gracilariopsis chorda]|uniref:Uncharacterized protein n=1 Tax=Gracilariopsis chorda TaxID=448386 RepID=A0A2V3IKG7_9FLOR|nr:hypothetical protein BWQ96_07701 [Gracilariopsis chorda]|eukprot:PXF42539.1 hypothetical protein BWQ96_07701 [Gracilariopsis chorda]